MIMVWFGVSFLVSVTAVTQILGAMVAYANYGEVIKSLSEERQKTLKSSVVFSSVMLIIWIVLAMTIESIINERTAVLIGCGVAIVASLYNVFKSKMGLCADVFMRTRPTNMSKDDNLEEVKMLLIINRKYYKEEFMKLHGLTCRDWDLLDRNQFNSEDECSVDEYLDYDEEDEEDYDIADELNKICDDDLSDLFNDEIADENLEEVDRQPIFRNMLGNVVNEKTFATGQRMMTGFGMDLIHNTKEKFLAVQAKGRRHEKLTTDEYCICVFGLIFGSFDEEIDLERALYLVTDLLEEMDEKKYQGSFDVECDAHLTWTCESTKLQILLGTIYAYQKEYIKSAYTL